MTLAHEVGVQGTVLQVLRDPMPDTAPIKDGKEGEMRKRKHTEISKLDLTGTHGVPKTEGWGETNVGQAVQRRL